jgi:hypothetical protein
VVAQWINLAVDTLDGAPPLEAFLISTQGSQPCLDAIADHQQHIGREQVGDVLLVGLELVERCPDVCLVIGGVLEFDHRQRQTIHIDHQIRAAVVSGALDRQLVHHQPVIDGGIVESDHLETDPDLLVPIHVSDGQTLGHPAVEVAVRCQQTRHVGVCQLEQRRFDSARWNFWIQALEC